MIEAAPVPASERRFVTGTRGRAICIAVSFAPVLGLAAAQGGFFPTSWGWATVPLFSVSIVVLIALPRVGLAKREWAFVAALAAFTAWIAFSIAWSEARTA